MRRPAVASSRWFGMWAVAVWPAAVVVGLASERAAFEFVGVPRSGGSRAVTFVEGQSRPFAVLIHDASVLDEPVLLESVVAATRLSAANAELQAVVNAQLAELTVSRRRLVMAADAERRRLDERLRVGAERRLETLELMLREEVGVGTAVARLDDVLGLLTETIDNLHQLAAGLHPRELDAGLLPALQTLVDHNPLEVVLDVRGEPKDVEVRTAVFYVCSEALANATKHSAGASVKVEVVATGDCVVVVVADDGVGGVDPVRGSGLRGLIDRVEALGGTLRVDSPPGAGTRLVVELPNVDNGGGP